MAREVNAAERLGFAVRVSGFYAAVFLVAGTYMPFLPLWLDWRGLGPAEIGVIFAVPLFVRIVVTPAIAFAADRLGDHRRVLILLSWGTLATLLVLSRFASFWPILLVFLVYALCWSTVMPLTETIAVSGVKRLGLDYGRMRLWGSLSFILASFVGGFVIDAYGKPAAIWLVVTGAAVSIFAAHMLPRPHQRRDDDAPNRPRLTLAEVGRLARMPSFLVFLLAAGAAQSAHAVFYTFGTLHLQKQGVAMGLTGVLWAIGVLSEIVLFAFSRRVVALLGPLRLLAIGGAAAVFRWIVMSFDPSLTALAVLQILHGATYGAAHLGAIYYIGERVPESQAGTAQALYAAVTAGIGMGLATSLAGRLYAAYGGGAYLGMAVIAAISLAATLWLMAADRASGAGHGAR